MIRCLLPAAVLAQVVSAPMFPHRALTPGATLPVSTAEVCVPGYSREVRDVSSATKREVFARYGLISVFADSTRNDFEVDHLIPLALGGSNDIHNLWPQAYGTAPWNARLKDRLENRLRQLVCAGELPLAEAQRAFTADWTAAYAQYVGAPSAEPAEGATSRNPSDAASASAATSSNNADTTSSRDINMEQFFLFAELPWLRRAFAYVIGLGVLWLAASIAAFLLAPILRRLRDRFHSFLEWFAGHQHSAAQHRDGLVASEIDDLRSSPHLRNMRRSGDSLLDEDEVSGAFRPFVLVVQRARETLTEARASFDGLHECLVATTISADQFKSPLPVANEIRDDHSNKRREAVHLAIGLLFLAALMSVNTGMLSQILKDAEIVPTNREFAGINLYYVFAFLLTGAEAGTGMLFGYLQSRVRAEKPASRLAPLFGIVLALAMAFVEAIFYSRVGAASASGVTAEDLVHIPLFDVDIPFTSVMFVWGFALVMLMFGAGMMIHNAYDELSKGSGLKRLRARLSSAVKESATLVQAMRVAEEQQHLLLNKTRQIVETFTSEFAIHGSPEALLKSLGEQLTATAPPPPRADELLSVAEMRELELRAVFWWWTAIATVVTCGFAFAAGSPLVSIRSSLIIFVLLAFGLGLDLAKQDVVAGLTVHAERLGRRMLLGRTLRVLGIVALVAIAFALLLRIGGIDALRPWFTLAATAIVVVLAGRELAPWAAFVVIHLRKLLNVGLWALGKALWFVCAVLYGAVVLLDAVAELVAAPVALVFGRKAPAQ